MLMNALSASELLSAWERGLGQRPAERALTLLGASDTESRQALSNLCIGRRDARLLSLRERLFGPEFNCLADCPNCAERLEFAFQATDIRLSPDPPPQESLSLTVGDWQIQFRLPNSEDLLKIADGKSVMEGRALLLERCILSIVRGEQAETLANLPQQIVNAVIQKMAESDAQADMQLSLSCPSCASQWQVSFDIAGFLWSEINAWAQRMLYDIHTLARAYGWREADILALSPWRRQAYLTMIGQ